MNTSNPNVYDGYPEEELIEQAHLAAIAREKRDRDEAIRRQTHKLEEIILLVAIANHTNTLTDALKIPVEPELAKTLTN